MAENCVKIAAVGDVMLGDRALMVGLGIRSQMAKSASYDPLTHVRDTLSNFDVVVGNLEAVLSDCGLVERDYTSAQMRGTVKSIDALKRAGFNVLSLANNHMMQHGARAFQETAASLKRNGILPIGCTDPNGEIIPQFLTIKGHKLGFLGYSLRPEKYTAHVLYAHDAPEIILRTVKKTRNECDFLIVSLHWGDEYVFTPSRKQQDFARQLAQSGASLILGHHPHVVQGVECSNNAIIAYSLGNFVFDVWQKRLRQSFILDLTLKNGAFAKMARIPVCIDRDFCPVISRGNEKIGMIFRLEKLDRLITSRAEINMFYKLRVNLNLCRNKIENRLLFIRNFFSYAPWVRKQSLQKFISGKVRS